MCAGTFLQKSTDKAWTIFEALSENWLHQGTTTVVPSQGPTWGSVLEVSHSSGMVDKIDELSKKLDQLMMMVQVSNPPPLRVLFPMSGSFI